MKRDNFWGEVTVAVVLVILLGLLANPYHFWMPEPVQMLVLAGLAVFYVVFTGLFWKESARDEREGLHRYIASRFGYLAGLTVLVLGVIVQSLRHALDPWLVYALAVMVAAKVAGRIYGQARH